MPIEVLMLNSFLGKVGLTVPFRLVYNYYNQQVNLPTSIVFVRILTLYASSYGLRPTQIENKVVDSHGLISSNGQDISE